MCRRVLEISMVMRTLKQGVALKTRTRRLGLLMDVHDEKREDASVLVVVLDNSERQEVG